MGPLERRGPDGRSRESAVFSADPHVAPWELAFDEQETEARSQAEARC